MEALSAAVPEMPAAFSGMVRYASACPRSWIAVIGFRG
jgi:hypothetical protein